mgnify:CR=1 FL=1
MICNHDGRFCICQNIFFINGDFQDTKETEDFRESRKKQINDITCVITEAFLGAENQLAEGVQERFRECIQCEKRVFCVIKNEWRKLAGNKIMIVVMIALLLIPSIYTTLFLGSMWDPFAKLDRLPVAVVNEDKGTVFEGKSIQAGEDLVEHVLGRITGEDARVLKEMQDRAASAAVSIMVDGLEKAINKYNC